MNMDVTKAEEILEKYGIGASLDAPWDVYRFIKNIGDPLSLGEHIILFDAFWKLGNIKRKSNVNLSDELKLKLILGRKRFENFWWIARGVIQGTTIPQIIEGYKLGSREQRELWDIFHKLWPAASSRDSEQINEALEIYKIVEHKLKRNKRINVLDIGCGKNGNGISSLTYKYGDKIRGFGIDIKIEERPPNVYLIEGTAERLPFYDNYFDLIYSHHLIYYFDERKIIDVVGEVLRVLRSGGMFVFDDNHRSLEDYSNNIILRSGIKARVFSINTSTFLIVKY